MVDLSGPALYDLIGPSTREWMTGLARRRDYGDGITIHVRGDSNSTMDVVIKGKIKLVRFRSDGSQSLVSTIRAGQHLADILMLNGYPRSHTAIAVGPVTIDHFDAAAFAKLMDCDEVLRALYAITGHRLASAIAMIDDLRTLPRTAHLAKLLFGLSARAGSDGVVGVVQEDLAAIVGVSVMTLAKALAVLKREGLVETRYRQIRIPDRALLAKWLERFEDE